MKNKKKIWLITIGEPLPTDGSNERLLRTGILANQLIEKGSHVVWWTSTFDHSRKKQRFLDDTYKDISDRLRIFFLHSISYQRNLSLSRVYNHWQIAQKFTKHAQNYPKPDIILCSLPTLELSLAAVKYGQQNQVPIVLDIRDLWPDIFLEVLPKWSPKSVRQIAKIGLSPLFKTLRQACSQANGIVGITPHFVDWGLKNAGRSQTQFDQWFPPAYTENTPSPTAQSRALAFWEQYNIKPNHGDFVICFFGSKGTHLRLETVIEAAQKLQNHRQNIKLVLCGNHEKYQNAASHCENLILPGWVGRAEIWTLMRMSSVGLLPYKSRKDFEGSIPNKVIEYMSAGLPILSSVQGELGRFILQNDIGMLFDQDDSESLVRCLCKLQSNFDLIAQKSSRVSNLYKKKFVAENVYSEMIEHLEYIAQSYQNYTSSL